MSTSYGNKLPDKLHSFLGIENRKRKNSAIFLVTSDDRGFPHIALLSPYQVASVSKTEFYLAIHWGTRSHGFLEKQRKTTLVVQLMPAVEYIKCDVEEVPGWGDDKEDVLFRCTPVEVLEDYSDKAPFVSELEFDEKFIGEKYSQGFSEIVKFLGRAKTA